MTDSISSVSGDPTVKGALAIADSRVSSWGKTARLEDVRECDTIRAQACACVALFVAPQELYSLRQIFVCPRNLIPA